MAILGAPVPADELYADDTDSNLALVVASWSKLPGELKAGIVGAITRAVLGQAKGAAVGVA